jgi:hypothetical protein
MRNDARRDIIDDTETTLEKVGGAAAISIIMLMIWFI